MRHEITSYETFKGARKKGWRRVAWSKEEVDVLKTTFPRDPLQKVMEGLPNRTWAAIQLKARKLRLRRPAKVPLLATLRREGDIGFSAGMVIADGSIMERCIITGKRRGITEGATPRRQRFYSTPLVQVTMEDKESLDRLAKLWGVRTSFTQKSSVGNKVWRVMVHGKKALDLLRLMFPFLEGEKKKKAQYLLYKYSSRTSLPVAARQEFRPFGGLE